MLPDTLVEFRSTSAINAIRVCRFFLFSGLSLLLAATVSAQPYPDQRPAFQVAFPVPGGGTLVMAVPLPDRMELPAWQPVNGYELLTFQGSLCRVPAQDLPLRIYVPDSRYVQVTRQAANAWNRVGHNLGGITFFEVVTVAGIPAVPIEFNRQDMPRQAAGVTTMRKTRDGVRINSIGISAMNLPQGNLAEVLAHELGHTLGLDHSQDPGDLMYRSTRSHRLESGDDVRLADRDIQMAGWLYSQSNAIPILANQPGY